ncbi:hypothetical protein [Nonomuraea sp. LPB2021202275-12-8]|uniref:hypothetical protein n=1 Tax=Nonomuraea sp. LPB2021202275-12-8 TaxID=3120159 RepID=UPI00300D2F18
MISSPPGAQEVTGLRARARAARRTACLALTCSVALLCAAQLLAERARTAQETLPLAVLALAVFLGALPTLAITQALWGARARAARRREQELYAAPPASPPRVLSRLAMAGGWVVLVLLGAALPRLFGDSGQHAVAAVLTSGVEMLALTGSVAVVCLSLWWARDSAGMPARASRSGGSPGDPWDPGPGARRRGGAVLWTGAVVAVAALLGARAHLWTPATAVVYALLAATFVCGLVTDE